MTGSMDTYVTKGKTDVQDKMKEGAEKITAIGNEIEGVKEQLKDMPKGLDTELTELIKDAEDSGKREALQDIDAVERAIIDTAKSTADSISSDVQAKISDNATAKGKLENINSKYGKDAVSRAKSAIDANTKKGEDLITMMKDTIKETERTVEGVKGKV